MHNVYLIGDCHTTRIYQHHDFNSKDIDLKIWGKAGLNAWDIAFDIEELKRNNTKASNIEYGDLEDWPSVLHFNDIKDDGLILAWAGYIDIKYNLPKYKNSEKVVINYINSLIKAFPNSKIKIIEPHPQFVEDMIRKGEGHEGFDYETREKQNKEFCKALQKYSLEFGLGFTITQQQIYEAAGLDKFTILDTIKGFHPDDVVDGLHPKYRVGIYNMFMDEIYGILSIR
jgi:hypothetical protein